MAIPHRITKFKSVTTFEMTVLGLTTKFNSRQYSQLYSILLCVANICSERERERHAERKNESLLHVSFHAGGDDCSVRLWEVVTGRCVQSLGNLPGKPLSLQFTPNKAHSLLAIAV